MTTVTAFAEPQAVDRRQMIDAILKQPPLDQLQLDALVGRFTIDVHDPGFQFYQTARAIGRDVFGMTDAELAQFEKGRSTLIYGSDPADAAGVVFAGVRAACAQFFPEATELRWQVQADEEYRVTIDVFVPVNYHGQPRHLAETRFLDCHAVEGLGDETWANALTEMARIGADLANTLEALKTTGSSQDHQCCCRT